MGRVTEKLRGIGLLGLFPLHAAITLLIHMQFVAALFHLFHLILDPCSVLEVRPKEEYSFRIYIPAPNSFFAFVLFREQRAYIKITFALCKG